MAIIFYILDCFTVGLDPKVPGLAIVMHGISLANLSLMSSCLGGGLFFNIILFWMMPRYIIRRQLVGGNKLSLFEGWIKRRYHLHNESGIKDNMLKGDPG